MASKLPFNQHTEMAADAIYLQLYATLQASGEELHDTPRRPDVRIIAENTGEDTAEFKNPGGHSSNPEQIPPSEAAMIMPKGDTLGEQQQNAQYIEQQYNITENGLTQDFLDDLKSGALSEYVAEAYGPAPLEKQANRLESVSWQNHDGSSVNVEPAKGEHGAVGARPPSEETVFAVRMPSNEDATIDVKGTETSAEHMHNTGDGHKTIYVGVEPVRDPDNDWQPTGEVTTKPISPDVAQDFYGQNLDNIPIVNLDSKGMLQDVELNPAQPDTAPNLVNNPLDDGPGGR